jgi:hypothetical protein
MYIPLEEGEEIIAKVHKHWWFIFLRIVLLAVILILPFALWLFISAFGLVVLSGTTTAAFVALAALWMLIGWIMFWQFWTLYYMDMWIVTNKRLIDIDYIAFFDRNIAMLRMERVQDFTVKVDSFWGNILGFGSLTVQTAGTAEEFIVEQISQPDKLRDIISRYAGQATIKTN